MVKNPHESYQNSVYAQSEMDQLIMLYDGAINYIKQAKEAIVQNDHETRYNSLEKAISIVAGLNSCLNFNEQTEETAKALDKYYYDIDIKLLNIQCFYSLEECDEVIEDLQTLRKAWIEISGESSSNNNDSQTEVTQAEDENSDENSENKSFGVTI